MAAAIPYVPSYLFKIDEIEQDPLVSSEADPYGHWMPSPRPVANRILAGNVSGKIWFCNGRNIQEISTWPVGAVGYNSFSVYYVGGVGIWALSGNVLNPMNTEIWHKLCFTYDGPNCASFLTNAGQYPTLRFQQSNSNWANLLLPDIYHTHNVPDHPIWGGVVGELPIFLALMALSTSREILPHVLPHMFRDGRWVATQQLLPRMDKRGVVVTLYTCPQYSPPPTNFIGSASDLLTRYAKGEWGRYFD